LRLVQAYVNTVDIENGIEELTDAVALRTVLVRIGALPRGASPLVEDEVAKAVEFREALRRLLLVNAGEEADSESLAVLERASAAARLSIRFERDARSTLVPRASGLDGAIGRILAIVYTSMADGTWPRLKACPRDVCGWISTTAHGTRRRGGARCRSAGIERSSAGTVKEATARLDTAKGRSLVSR
jgi:hypothetical protein